MSQLSELNQTFTHSNSHTSGVSFDTNTLISEKYRQHSATDHDELLPFIDKEAEPVFITDPLNNLILVANKAATRSNGGRSHTGKPLEQLLWCQEKVQETCTLAWFDRKWLHIIKESFSWKGRTCQKVTLAPPLNHPNLTDIEHAKNMIAVMLHRFRSPMTGMQGYLDLLMGQHENDDSTKRLEILNSGMEQLNEMLDEMDVLYGTNPDTDAQTFYIQALIQDIVEDIKPVSNRPVSIHVNGKKRPVEFSRKKAEALIKILLNNAIEHPCGNSPEIAIDIVSTRKIVITNYGEPISEYIKNRMFSPFMTNKAQNMGIGLTRAYLLAKYIGATIVLTSNSSDSGISFTVLLPPSVSYL